MNKTLLVVRHAHRDKNFGSQTDNGLSEKGWAQAARLLSFFEKKFQRKTPALVSSPKKRCIETISPIAKKNKVETKVVDLLDEQGPSESDASFFKRVRDFAKWWKTEAPEFTVLCSHGDWIPEFANVILGRSFDLRKGAAAELSLKGETIKLEEIEQEP